MSSSDSLFFLKFSVLQETKRAGFNKHALRKLNLTIVSFGLKVHFSYTHKPMKEGKGHMVPLFKYSLVIGPVPKPPKFVAMPY